MSAEPRTEREGVAAAVDGTAYYTPEEAARRLEVSETTLRVYTDNFIAGERDPDRRLTPVAESLARSLFTEPESSGRPRSRAYLADEVDRLARRRGSGRVALPEGRSEDNAEGAQFDSDTGDLTDRLAHAENEVRKYRSLYRTARAEVHLLNDQIDLLTPAPDHGELG